MLNRASINRNLYLFLQKVIGSNANKYYKEFFSLESSSKSKLADLTALRLENLLANSQNIPFYRRYKPLKSQYLDDWPILTKSALGANFKFLMNNKLEEEYFNKTHKLTYGWIEVKSGGTTGTPVTVIHSKELRDRGRASRLYSQYLCNFPFGTPYFRLWGSMNDINNFKQSLTNRAQSFFASEVLLNAFRMDEDNIKRYISVINNTEIDFLMAYIDAVHEIAKFAKENSYCLRPLKSIMSCAGTLTVEARQLLSAMFSAKVHNKYGSRECGDIACECKEGKLHIYSNQIIVEVVDDNGYSLGPNQIGHILVTVLFSHSFPLIRYEIGDMGAISNEICSCGRPFPILQNIEGRKQDFLKDSKGSYVSPVFIRHLIGVVHNPGFIKKFQLVQKNKNLFILKLALHSGYSELNYQEMISKINKDFKNVFGHNSVLTIELHNDILSEKSGKFLYTINEAYN